MSSSMASGSFERVDCRDHQLFGEATRTVDADADGVAA
jgi:hypothetical protein